MCYVLISVGVILQYKCHYLGHVNFPRMIFGIVRSSKYKE